MKLMCATMVRAGDQENKHKVQPCGEKARLFVMARGGKHWDGYYCLKHGPWIIKKRMRLIRKYNQNVVLRPITEYDKKRYKERKRRDK